MNRNDQGESPREATARIDKASAVPYPSRMRNELGLGSSMSNGSGTVIGIETSVQGPFTNKNRKDKDEESYGQIGIS